MNNFNMNKDQICRLAGWGNYAAKNDRFYECFKEANNKMGVSMEEFETLYPIIHPFAGGCGNYKPNDKMIDAINGAMNLLNRDYQTPTDLFAHAQDLHSSGGYSPFYYGTYYGNSETSTHYARNKFAEFIYAYATANPDQVEMLEVKTCGVVAIRAYRLK